MDAARTVPAGAIPFWLRESRPVLCSTGICLSDSGIMPLLSGADKGIAVRPDQVAGMGDKAELTVPAGEDYRQLDRGAVEPGLAQRVAGGGLWALGSQGARLVTALIVTPYVIRKLGSENYGLLALVTIMIGYMTCADLGMGLASTKFGTAALAGRGEKAEAAAVWTSLLITLVPMGIGAGAVFLAARPLVAQLLRLPDHLQGSAIQAIRLGIVTACALVLNSILNTPQLTRLKLRANSIIETCVGLLQSCTVLAVLGLGGGVTAVVAAGAFAALVGTLAHFSVSSRLCPSLQRPRYDPSLIRPLLRFGAAVIAGVAVGSLIGQGEKFLLVRWGSTRELAYYSIAMTISGLLVALPNALAQPLMPGFVQLLSFSEGGRLERLYNQMLAGVMLTILPIALLICVSAKPFLTLWAGAEFGRASLLPLYILLAGVVVKAASYVPGALLIALGRVDLMPKFQAAELLPYGLIMVALVARFGIIGAAIAWSLRSLAESLLLFVAAGRLAHIRQRPLPGNPLDYCLAFVALIAPVSATWALLPARALIFLACVPAIAGYVAIVVFRIATPEEKAWFGIWIRGLRRRGGV